MSKISYRNYRDIAFPLETRKRREEKWYGFWIRWISTAISWSISDLKSISPNMVTGFMIFWSFPASLLIAIPGYWGILAFFLGYQFWTTLDSIDGELARFRKQYSNTGKYLDSIGHFVINAIVFVALGWKFYELSGDNPLYLILGFIGAILITFDATAYHSGKFYLLEKNVILKEVLNPKTNIIVYLFREIHGFIEISMIGSIFLVLFALTKNPLLPEFFFIGYILLFIIGIIVTIFSSYKNLNKLKKPA